MGLYYSLTYQSLVDQLKREGGGLDDGIGFASENGLNARVDDQANVMFIGYLVKNTLTRKLANIAAKLNYWGSLTSGQLPGPAAGGNAGFIFQIRRPTGTANQFSVASLENGGSIQGFALSMSQVPNTYIKGNAPSPVAGPAAPPQTGPQPGIQLPSSCNPRVGIYYDTDRTSIENRLRQDGGGLGDGIAFASYATDPANTFYIGFLFNNCMGRAMTGPIWCALQMNGFQPLYASRPALGGGNNAGFVFQVTKPPSSGGYSNAQFREGSSSGPIFGDSAHATIVSPVPTQFLSQSSTQPLQNTLPPTPRPTPPPATPAGPTAALTTQVSLDYNALEAKLKADGGGLGDGVGFASAVQSGSAVPKMYVGVLVTNKLTRQSLNPVSCKLDNPATQSLIATRPAIGPGANAGFIFEIPRPSTVVLLNVQTYEGTTGTNVAGNMFASSIANVPAEMVVAPQNNSSGNSPAPNDGAPPTTNPNPNQNQGAGPPADPGANKDPGTGAGKLKENKGAIAAFAAAGALGVAFIAKKSGEQRRRAQPPTPPTR